MVCLLAASLVQLSVSAGNGWPHNALRHYWLMPISCHFRDCKAPLVTGVTHVSGGGAIASVQTLPLQIGVGSSGWFFFLGGGRRGTGAGPYCLSRQLMKVSILLSSNHIQNWGPVSCVSNLYRIGWIRSSQVPNFVCDLTITGYWPSLAIPASDLKIAYTIMTLSLSPIIITTSRSSIYKNLRLPPLFSPFTYEPHFTMQRHKIQFAGSIVKLHKYYQQMQRLVARHFQGVDSRSE